MNVRATRPSRSVALAAVVAAPLIVGCGGDHVGARGSGVPATAPTEMLSLQQQFVRVVNEVSPSVVQIRTAQGLGSGVVFDSGGDVVTNAHVVGDATHLLVTLASGQRHAASLVGKDVGNDLAVIRLSGGTRPPPAAFADSSALQVGDLALALGSPLGLRSTVTQGIVSAVGRSVAEGNGVSLSSVIQTSAEINPGNSGGALVDTSGRVVGIPTLAALDPEIGGQAAGIAFAISSNMVRRVASDLIGSAA